MKSEFTKEWCMNMAKIEARADDAATMCVWCETRVPGACKSRYDTLTCTHRVFVPTAEQWDSAVEARAAELHEGCRMPMEQAQELAASEMSEGRKALLAAFGAASAAREQDLRGQYPKAARVLAEEVFSLRAALRQKHAEYDDMKSLLLGNARNLNLEGERAREVLHRMLEAPTTQISATWKDAARQGLAGNHKGADTRKHCTCDGAGRGPGRECVVKAGGRLGDLWRCADGLGA